MRRTCLVAIGFKPFNKSHWRSMSMFIWLNTKVAKESRELKYTTTKTKHRSQRSDLTSTIPHGINISLTIIFVYLFAAHSKHNKYRFIIFIALQLFTHPDFEMPWLSRKFKRTTTAYNNWIAFVFGSTMTTNHCIQQHMKQTQRRNDKYVKSIRIIDCVI